MLDYFVQKQWSEAPLFNLHVTNASLKRILLELVHRYGFFPNQRLFYMVTDGEYNKGHVVYYGMCSPDGTLYQREDGSMVGGVIFARSVDEDLIAQQGVWLNGIAECEYQGVLCRTFYDAKLHDYDVIF